jgi:hypothetical protein
VYSREVEGQVLEFGVSGKLVMNVLVMYDRQTDTLWSQLLGEGIRGPLKGVELDFVPAEHTTWEDWKSRHPDTLALIKGYSGNFDNYAGYYNSSSAGAIGESNRDGRLSTKEFVIGVALGNEAAAYPFRSLSATPVVNDHVGGTPVLVVFDPESANGFVYDRRIDSQELEFELVGQNQLIDRDTGTLWDLFSGEALEGDYVGQVLQRVKSTRSFWFGWSDFYPDTRVHGED